MTSAIVGNCGVGLAPCKPQDPEKLIELIEGVEDIPGPVMHEGLTWQWETFDENLCALETGNHDIDIGCMLPHTAVGVYLMRERAIRHEKATEVDIAQVYDIIADAVQAGAFGLATSRTLGHKSCSGEYTPTLQANE